jgi:hypothetical protein
MCARRYPSLGLRPTGKNKAYNEIFGRLCADSGHVGQRLEEKAYGREREKKFLLPVVAHTQFVSLPLSLSLPFTSSPVFE